MKTNANTSTLVSRQLQDYHTPSYALQLAAKELGLDELSPQLGELVTATRLNEGKRHKLVTAIRRAAKTVYGVRAERVVFDPSIKKANPTGLFPFACGTLLDSEGVPLRESQKPKLKSAAKTLPKVVRTKLVAKANQCKCKYCGGGVDEFSFKINKGACHKPKCVLAAMREHL